MWRSTLSFPLGTPVKVCSTPLWGAEGRVHCWPDPIGKPSESLVEIKLLDYWPLDVGRSGCRCETHGSSSKPPSSSDVLSLEAAASSPSLSKTSSEIRHGDRNLRVCQSPLMTAEKKNIQSKRQRSETPRYFSCCMVLVFYKPVSLCPLVKHKWNHNPVRFGQRGLSIST